MPISPVAIFFIILGLLLVLYIILDVVRVNKIKIRPIIPQMENKFLSRSGLTRVYEYFRDPSLIPNGIKLTDEYILNELHDVFQYIDSRYDCAETPR